MFIINHKTGHYNYRVEDTERNILGGMIATFTENRKVAVCEPSQIPIGFFSSDYTPPHNSIWIDDYAIGVLIGQGDYQTDVCEQREYRTNELLYCNTFGKISNNPKYKGNPTVGIVNDVGIDENGYFYIGFISYFSNLESLAKPHKKVVKIPSKSKNKFNRYTALF